MDFFAHQDRARASTRRLLFFYTLALLGVLVTLDVIAVIIFGASQSGGGPAHAVDNDPAGVAMVVTLTTLGVLAIVVLATIFKQIQVGGDGAKIAELLGGRPITGAATDLDERKLMNVVEEMSLASGVPMPRVYVMDGESAINAFASGTRPEAAVIGITRGAIQRLNRDELQGVIAHEFSHILNGDMRLNLRLIALNFGIMAIGYIGLQILRFSPRSTSASRNKKDNNAMAMILLAALAMTIIGYIGTLFGKMLQAAVSRQREYLADASAVQFTRNPSGISGALKKIGGLTDGSTLKSSHAGEASHMFFGDGVSGFLDSIFATHPPLEKRIKAIDPSFDGKMLSGGGDASGISSVAASGFAGGGSGVVAPPPLPRAGQRIAVDPGQIRAARSVIEPHELDFAAVTLQALPAELVAAARDPYDARALALALLLDPFNPEVRGTQLRLVAQVDEPLAAAIDRFGPLIIEAGPAARLPLLDLALSPLHQLSPTQLQHFRELCQRCAEADGHITPFELAVYKILDRQLPLTPPRSLAGKYRSVGAVSEAIGVLLSVLAEAGGEAQAEAAFAAGVAKVGLPVPRSAGYDPRSLSAALDMLAEASTGVQRRVVEAAAHTVAADRSVRIEEMELMRALCAALAVPIPPLLVRGSE